MAGNRWLLLSLLLTLFVVLSYAVLSLPEHAEGLQEVVADKIKVSGVSHPVTAVLLNFRGYDTLLEMGVLLVALLGVWSLGGIPDDRETRPGPVLATLTRMLVPLLILVAGYLLWLGAHAPGGAFQAGSVLAAAGVLLLLSGWRLSKRFSGLSLRLILVSGLGVFVITGAGFLLIGNAFMEYPVAIAGGLILMIEAAATLSIGATLAALFLGSRPATGLDK